MHAIDLPNLKSCMEEPSSNYLVKELKEARALISRLNMEKEGFMHDLADAKIAKLASDTLVAQQGVRLGEAEKDLNFYQVTMFCWQFNQLPMFRMIFPSRHPSLLPPGAAIKMCL